MRAYSLDLRTRILADCDKGKGTREVATKFSVSESWVRRLQQRRRQSGETAPRTARPRTPALAEHYDRLRALVKEQPDLTLAELRGRLGLAVALSTLWAALRRLGLALKKKSSAPPSRTAPTSTRRASSGGPASRGSSRAAGCSSTRPGPART